MPKPRFNPLRLLLGLLVLLAIIGGVIFALARLRANAIQEAAFVDVSVGGGTELNPPRPVRDFTLTSSSGEPITRADLQGKHNLVAFGYTHCPDVCPLTLTEFKRVKRELTPEQAAQVDFVFVSVDGQRDTPDLLRQYLARFDPAFIGISTDDDNRMQRLAEDFAVYYAKRENTGSQAAYMVDHTASLFLLNPDGNIVRVFAFGTPPVEIAAALKARL